MTKTCPLCGTEAADDAARCPKCTFLFSLGGMGLPEGATPTITTIQFALARPTGGVPKGIGCCCLATSLLLLLISGGSESLAAQSVALIVAGALFSLFLMLWSVGYIVRAISFLPERGAQ